MKQVRCDSIFKEVMNRKTEPYLLFITEIHPNEKIPVFRPHSESFKITKKYVHGRNREKGKPHSGDNVTLRLHQLRIESKIHNF